MQEDPEAISEFRFRIVYDALARFTTSINKCETINQIKDALNISLKYLFNCYGLRFNVECADKSYIINTDDKFKTANKRFSFEEEVFNKRMPIVLENDHVIKDKLKDELPSDVLADLDSIWSWPFTLSGDNVMVASVFSSEAQRFKKSDIPVLRIVCESLFPRIKNLNLLEEITESKEQLQIALEKVEEKNLLISKLVSRQDKIIELRTDELRAKNEKLSNIALMNAHNFREPLTRILGLISLVDHADQEEIINKIIPMLLKSSNDLDHAIKKNIKYIEDEN